MMLFMAGIKMEFLFFEPKTNYLDNFLNDKTKEEKRVYKKKLKY